MTKNWVDIEGYEGLYQVSNDGSVKSLARTWVSGHNTVRCKPDTIMKGSINPDGYRLVLLSKNSKIKGFSVHRLVATYFVPNPLNLPEVNHIDGDKLNNNDWNLEWCTHKDNMQHATNTGLIKSGPTNHLYGRIRGLCTSSKKVIDTKTGTVYDCAIDAAEYYKMKPNTLRAMLSGKNKNKTTLKYYNYEKG